MNASVSVVIPTFNRADRIGQAISSVLDQAIDGLEIIVVDDGSTDHTTEVVARFGSRVRYLTQSRAGVSAARNAGIRAAASDRIALLDSDDWWLPGKLAAQMRFFDYQTEALICQTEEIWIRNGRRVNPGRRHLKPAGMIFKRSLALCLISPSAVLMRRALLEKVGLFDETLPACEDYDLWLRVASRYPVHLIVSPLIAKTGGHPDQLSRQSGLDRYRIAAIDKILRSDHLARDQRRAATAMLIDKCRIYAAGCRKHGKTDEADRVDATAAHWTRLAGSSTIGSD